MSMKKIVLGVLAHVDAGKTTLSEALLYTTGSIRKLGRVDHRNTALDTHQIERERGITVFSKQAQLRTDKMELCLLDTPGHADLTAETERTLGVIDYALLVISGTDGVQAHTETLWRLLEKYGVPVMIFATKMDLEICERERILSELRERLSEGCYDPLDGSEENAERIAVSDERLFEKYAGGERIDDTDIADAIRARRLFPVLFGSGLKLDGVAELVSFIEKFTVAPEYGAQFGAKVYKIMRDGRDRRLACMKITGGTLKNRDSVNGETVTELRVYNGAGYETVQEASAGSIVAVQGLGNAYAGQGLGFEGDMLPPEAEPVLSYTVELPEGADKPDALKKLRQLEDEDPQLRLEWNDVTKNIHIHLMGRVQTEVLTQLIRERFDMDVRIGAGGIAYKETIAEPVYGAGHFEPLRHYAEVHLLIEPSERGSGLHFESRCSTDELDRNWQSLIMSELEAKTHLGVLTGSPLTDVKISLIAGKAHVKHTEGGDFREAACRAVRQGLMKAKSVLLEPWYEFRIELSPEHIGRAISDIRAMSGKFDTEGSSVIFGTAPVSEMSGYAEVLASYTSGKGRISLRSAGYYPCHDAQRVIEAAGYEPESDLPNTPDSVFCSHGSGTIVKWSEADKFMHLDPAVERETAPAAPLHRFYTIDDAELEAIMEREFGPVRRRQYTRAQPVRSEEFSVAPSKREYVIVDGYNFIFGTAEYAALAKQSLDLARARLTDVLRSYRAMRDCELVLVFDGYRVSGNTGERETSGIRTVYTKENETADMYIERLANDIGKNYSVKVVTNDSLIRLSAMRSGVLRMSVAEFESELRLVMEKIMEYIDGKR